MDCGGRAQSQENRDRGEEMMTHAMTCSWNLCHCELLEVVLLQRWQNAHFEALIVPDEHAYI